MNLVVIMTLEEFHARGWFEVPIYPSTYRLYVRQLHHNHSIVSIVSLQEPKTQNAVAHGIGTQNMLELTPQSGQKPFKKLFDWGVLFPYVAQVVRSEKFEYRQVGDPFNPI